MTLLQAGLRPVVLAALTTEARAGLGAAEIEITRFPFRGGRESRGNQRAAGRVIMPRRKAASGPKNELHLVEHEEPFNASRGHLQIEHNGTHYVLVDRQSTSGRGPIYRGAPPGLAHWTGPGLWAATTPKGSERAPGELMAAGRVGLHGILGLSSCPREWERSLRFPSERRRGQAGTGRFECHW